MRIEQKHLQIHEMKNMQTHAFIHIFKVVQKTEMEIAQKPSNILYRERLAHSYSERSANLYRDQPETLYKD